RSDSCAVRAALVAPMRRPQSRRSLPLRTLPASLPRNDHRTPATSDVPPTPPAEPGAGATRIARVQKIALVAAVGVLGAASASAQPAAPLPDLDQVVPRKLGIHE